ncbi:uncharacterized protein BDW47DRAFT_98919 [Aspergillus candidus]|uniref:Uncharacterized protein n=1 Tax=Aspergillus candidus TaxID=41067 RepID=A0A2I2FMY2_ASPCN|nr:hypothetical protein BDW47DRAFT_98919 [Aspergillus candidus]PLB41985.1 hypothetical protein BDW47DRAFT_98919 [Aspergillus candidus]
MGKIIFILFTSSPLPNRGAESGPFSLTVTGSYYFQAIHAPARAWTRALVSPLSTTLTVEFLTALFRSCQWSVKSDCYPV